MRLYLDCCCLNRPFDDLRQERVRMEAEAIIFLLSRVETGSMSLLSSDILLTEISYTPNVTRRRACLSMLSYAKGIIPLSQEVKDQAARLALLGLKPMDAAHVASAIVGSADVFLTVDDRLLNLLKRIGNTQLGIATDSPVSFLLKLTGDNP